MARSRIKVTVAGTELGYGFVLVMINLCMALYLRRLSSIPFKDRISGLCGGIGTTLKPESYNGNMAISFKGIAILPGTGQETLFTFTIPLEALAFKLFLIDAPSIYSIGEIEYDVFNSKEEFEASKQFVVANAANFS